MERGFLACMSSKETGRTADLGRKSFSYFPFYKKIQQIPFEFKLHEFKFKNQTTSNKTMQNCMNANRQPHLDLEKQPIFIYFY
jgi:hypothetical protein